MSVALGEANDQKPSVSMGNIAGVLGILAATASAQLVFTFLVNASGALMVFIYVTIAVAHLRHRARAASAAAAVR
jgi:AAT family amino acid transporter/GABA permease